ncbi:MAG: shikimate kinase [Parvibaculales bacterium]
MNKNPKAAKIKIDVTCPIVLIGMMGAGKSSLGKRLANELSLPFRDADDEIEKAAGMSIADIFDKHGEAAFRDGEQRVIARLLQDGPQVLALGGGAFVNPDTRALIEQSAVSLWLDVDLDELVQRVNRNPGKRPLLVGTDVRAKLTELNALRRPIYELADLRVNISRTDARSSIRDMKKALATRFEPLAEQRKNET